MKPVAWYDPSNGVVSTDKNSPLFTPLGQVWPLFSQRPWVGLTNDEVNDFAAGCHLGNSVQGAIYKAEARLKEKNL
jgi:hypothetical protein